MDGTLVIVSLFDTTISVIFGHTSKIFDILRVFRLVRALRPLRVINRAPGLKLVVQTLLSSLKPIGNIVLICCTFFIIFGILGVQVPALFFLYLYQYTTTMYSTTSSDSFSEIYKRQVVCTRLNCLSVSKCFNICQTRAFIREKLK